MVQRFEDRIEYTTPHQIDFSVCTELLFDHLRTKNSNKRFSIIYGRSFPSGESALRQEWAQIYQVMREGNVIQRIFFPKRKEVAFVHCFRKYSNDPEKRDKITMYSQEEGVLPLARIEEIAGWIEEE